MSLRIWDKVKTELGEGILIKVETPFNGLYDCPYVDYNNAKCEVWYGRDNPGNNKVSGTQWIVKEFYYNDLLEWNKDKVRDEKLDELGI